MYAANSLGFLAGLGWPGWLAFPVCLIGYLLVSMVFVRWMFGDKPHRGHRLLTGIVVAAVFLGLGKLAWSMTTEYHAAKWREQVGWGGGAGLGLGFWFILMSVKRAEPDESVKL